MIEFVSCPYCGAGFKPRGLANHVRSIHLSPRTPRVKPVSNYRSYRQQLKWERLQAREHENRESVGLVERQK